MSTLFPTSLDNLDPTRGTTGQTLASPNHITHHQNEDDAIEALQAKVGVDSSAVTTSLDYLIKSASSTDPGHKHPATKITNTPAGTIAATTVQAAINELDGDIVALDAAKAPKASPTFTGTATITNTTDAVSNQVLKLEGDSATPANNDEIYQSFVMSDSAGNQDEFGRITVQATEVTSTTEDASIDFSVAINGTLTNRFRIIGTAIFPTSNDALTLGLATNNFADAFLANGATINFRDAGNTAADVSITHSTGILTVAPGDLRVTTTGTNSASVVTVGGAQTLTNKRITKRTGTTTSSATPTINTDNYDMYTLTAQAADITSFTTNLSGTPTDGQTLWIAITGTAARAITWGASFEASTVALPTTTVSTNRLDCGFVWNAATSKWRIVAKA